MGRGVNVTAGVGERARHTFVPHHARGASLARTRLLSGLRAAGVDAELASDAVTVVSELVGNAARHARALRDTLIEVSWSVLPDRVQVAVIDGGSAETPALRSADWDAVDGRGLQIVAALASRWGVQTEDGRRRVWAELVAVSSDGRLAV
ncbi:hypothetical protein NUM_00500 [Actinocatenispora comari]|jgi:anti-sigma regulatory factor (Ser/Thr protein kinase)|uniref:Histidine kinase/HSP90-like ATPase domain-containing protein n=1 Tax=Actinocatenispora comari TaxID=2807577 RepID=A0A8J4A650_9ACTN|nr:hypothetical protein NUM_00500 [Actinocatenispora comari]